MTINTQRFSVSELDFDAIKTSIKTFMQGQTQFTDYNFDGANLSIMLDVLAYNTHYRALYDNFILNEMFLDSASKRENVVSRAKELGYMPSSAKCAIATVAMTITNTVNGPSVLILPALSVFVASLSGATYQFITRESYSIIANGSTYTLPNIKLYQGQYMTDRFNVSNGSKYQIKNTNVDTSTLSIKVQDNAYSSVYRTYTLADSMVGIKSTDLVFWLKEIAGGLYEIEFGNGVIGSAVEAGNVIQAEYIITSGSIANGAMLFNYSGGTVYNGTITMATTAASFGGSEIETTDSVKFNAPRLYSTQNRAVTVEDYQNLVYNLVPDAQSVNVWSGADNIPPVYGKVFICIKPKTVPTYTNTQKVTITNDIIGSKNLVTVIPVIVDPTYIKVAVTTAIYYDQKTTTKSANDIKLIAMNAILAYGQANLLGFDSTLRFSKLSRQIDDADSSIVSNITTLVIYRTIDPKYNTLGSYTINIVNPIYSSGLAESCVVSTGFYILGSDLIHYIEDDGLGNLRLYNQPSLIKQTVNARIGTVDYTAGSIQINGIYITSIVGAELNLIIKPSSYDVVSVLDQLVIIPPELLNITVIADKSAAASGGGTNYTFTSSRS